MKGSVIGGRKGREGGDEIRGSEKYCCKGEGKPGEVKGGEGSGVRQREVGNVRGKRSKGNG